MGIFSKLLGGQGNRSRISNNERVPLLTCTGEAGGFVIFDEKGAANLELLDGQSDVTASLMAMAVSASVHVPLSDRIAFSEWAELSLDRWGIEHKWYFGVGFLHFLEQLKQSGVSQDAVLDEMLSIYQTSKLPPLKRPLSPEVMRMFGWMLRNQK